MTCIGPVSMRSETGVPAPRQFIPLSEPEIRGNEWEYVKECLDTGWVSSAGSFVERFERQTAEYLGARHAVATVNGTAALHVAVLVSGVSPDDEVVVPSLTFIAAVNSIRYAGAWPVFVDSEPSYFQMDPEKTIDFLDKGCRWHEGALHNKSTGRRVRGILPVHILGHPADLDPVLEAAKKYDLVVIEDATEGLGAHYGKRKVGRLGDVSCLSFNGNKLITTGGGGMLLTDNEEWASKARYLTTQAKDDPVESIHGEVGFNYRLTNLQSALGCAQLECLEEYVAKKRAIAACYSDSLGAVEGIVPMSEPDGCRSTFWMYTILVEEGRAGSRALMKHLHDGGIQTRPLWQPNHLSPAYAEIGPFACGTAERLNDMALSLPCSVGLSAEQQERVIESVIAFVADRK